MINLFLRSAAGGSPPGLVRRILRRLGPSWEAAPVRRITQAAALTAFLVLFFYVTWPYGDRDYAALRQSKERIDAETFLLLDPLVGVSAAMAARMWLPALAWAAAVLAACIVLPRFFCGYLCPLGTLIDVGDWLFAKLRGNISPVEPDPGNVDGVPRPVLPGRVFWGGSTRASQQKKRTAGQDPPWHTGVSRTFAGFNRSCGGPWRHVRFYILAAVLVAAAAGVMAAGYVAAIPVLVRGMAFLGGPVQLGAAKGWYLIPAVGAGQIISVALLAVLVVTVLLGRRFWCRHLCPSGALVSAAGLARLAERRVDASCIACGKCVRACAFGAVRPDFSTQPLDCTFCQTCGGVCPVGAISFGRRGALEPAAEAAGYPLAGRSAGAGTGSPAAPAAGSNINAGLSRRGLLAGAAVGAAAALGVRVGGAGAAAPLVRPPGSVPEPEFLRLCVRCGLCYQACPNNVLQPGGVAAGLDALWTPVVTADWSGCEPTCNNCGQVCPTRAIRPLAIEEKRVARIGLAVVNPRTCLPHAGREACQMCVDDCRAAGYDAIEFVRVGVETDADGRPVEGSGLAAPVVVPEKCNGCGLCQSRCRHINVDVKGLLTESAIRVEAGPGKEDRLSSGSYLALREAERQARDAAQPKPAGGGDYLPDFLK